MSLIHTVLRQYKDTSPNAISLQESITGNAEFNLDQSVPVGTNTQYHMAFTRANLQSLCIYGADAVTIKTNSSSAPTDTITIPASPGQALIWTLTTDGIGRCPFTADVTTLYITNATSNPVAVKIRGLLNQ